MLLEVIKRLPSFPEPKTNSILVLVNVMSGLFLWLHYCGCHVWEVLPGNRTRLGHDILCRFYWGTALQEAGSLLLDSFVKRGAIIKNGLIMLKLILL